jgi:predicted hotdog family 3-hydroxylacyl-ACP dehydratase
MIRTVNRLSAADSKQILACCPGSNGARNLTLSSPRRERSGKYCRNAKSIRPKRYAPGTTGDPGKCPWTQASCGATEKSFTIVPPGFDAFIFVSEDFNSSSPIASLLPHQPPMILIDKIDECWPEGLRCSSNSHLDPSNPLRQNGVLSIFAGVEYAAQAMALHARLTSNREREHAEPRKGFLASAKQLRAHARNLDDRMGRLSIEVNKLAGDDTSSLYLFAIAAAGHLLLEGQLMAVMAEDGAKI